MSKLSVADAPGEPSLWAGRTACRPLIGRCLAILTACCAVHAPVLAQYGTAAEPYDYVIFIPEPVNASDQSDMEQAANNWSDYFRETGVGEFRGRFFSTLAEADAFIVSRRAAGKSPAFAVIDPLIALKRDAAWGATPILCPVYKGRNTIRRVVVTARSSAAASLADLKGTRLASVKMMLEAPDVLGLVLFDDAVDPLAYFSEIVPTAGLNDCLVAVLRRQADAALVNQAYFESARIHNRTVWRELKVVVELPERHLSPMVIFPETPAEIVEALRVAVLNAQNSDAGRHILDVYNIDGFSDCGRAEFDAIEGKMIAKLRGSPGGARAAAPPQGGSKAPPPAAGPGMPGPTVELEKDLDNGDVTVIARFEGRLPPVRLTALVSLDGGGDSRESFECAADVCVLTLGAARVADASTLTVALLAGRGESESALGEPKSFPLARN